MKMNVVLIILLSTLLLAVCDDNVDSNEVLEPLQGHCWDYTIKNEWWTYRWCYKSNVEQLHFPRRGREPSVQNSIAQYIRGEPDDSAEQYFVAKVADCEMDNGNLFPRKANVSISCCSKKQNSRRQVRADISVGTHIRSVEEYLSCHYKILVCSDLLCNSDNPPEEEVEVESKSSRRSTLLPPKRETAFERHGQDAVSNPPQAETPKPTEQTPQKPKFTLFADNIEEEIFRSATVSVAQQAELRERVRDMFYHGYNSYMTRAYPLAELRPISCTGGKFDLIKIPYVTLIDTLDTLVVFGDHLEFKRAVRMLTETLRSFDFDVNVSVFETTIRVLGGLVSAHLMAVDPQLQIYSGTPEDHYDNELLHLATDLGDRLLPAFRTVTGIPYGTVNLVHGVPKGEVELASTAGAGSLVLEFEVLTYLTGDVKYGKAAMKAAEEIFHRRSELGLVGKHIHVRSGKWHETLSGVGSNSDSFYEYLIKAYLLFRRKEYYDMFSDVFTAAKTYSMSGDWFVDVDMHSGKMRKKRSENLQAFWPGMEAMLGMTESSARLLNAFYIVWRDVGFLPEEFDYVAWAPGKPGAVSQLYPLRPELIESTYLHYRATGDRSWLIAGREFLLSLQTHTRTECGYATVKDVMSRELEDSMPSFFLSETCKYLFLLFDEHNFIHNRGYIFTTEAHPIDPMQLAGYNHGGSKSTAKQRKGKNSGFLELFDRFFGSLTGSSPVIGGNEFSDMYVASGRQEEEEAFASDVISDERSEQAKYLDWKQGRDLHEDIMKCPKSEWWSYNPYVRIQNVVGSLEALLGDEEVGDTLDGTKAIGIEKIFQMLANSITKPNKLKSQDPLDGKTACSVDDDPSVVNASPGSPTPASPAQLQERMVELEVGDMGTFIVSIFPDGFIVKSKKYGNTMEIAGVGQSAIFVKEFNSTHAATASASFGGAVTVCSVRMKVDWPEGAPGDFNGKETWGSRDYNKAYLPAELEKERCCSLAAFGATASPATFPITPIIAPLLRPADVSSCNVPGRVTASLENIETGQTKPAAVPTVAPLEQPPRSFFQRMFDKRKQRDSPRRQSPSKEYDGSVVLADRGNCMFEQKAIYAEEGGAVGLIVVNSESNLFMMSGMKQPLSEGDVIDDDAPEAVKEKTGKTTIPSVMVTSQDGKYIISAAEYLQEKGIDSMIVMEMHNVPAILDNPAMGFSGHPNIRVGESLMHIVGLGEWGAALSKQGNEWQLYIVPKKELQAVSPWALSTNRGQLVTSNNAFSFNPVNVYSQMISEQCPAVVSNVDNAVKLFKFEN